MGERGIIWMQDILSSQRKRAKRSQSQWSEYEGVCKIQNTCDGENCTDINALENFQPRQNSILI